MTMEKKYNCICTYGTENLSDFKKHLLKQGMIDGKGKHKSLKKAALPSSPPANQEARLAEIEKNLVTMANKRTENVEPPKEAQTLPKPKEPGRRWWLVLLGIVLIIAGCAVSYYGNSKTSSVLVVAGLIGIIPGGYLVFKGFKKQEPELPAVGTDGKTVPAKLKGKENCVNIYPREMGGIKFEYMANPPSGLPQQCVNNGKKYFVNIWNPGITGLECLIFPDEKYYDPRVLAEVVEAEPVRRYFELAMPLLEKIAPWAFVAAIGLALLAIIILPGALNPTGG